MKLVFVRHGETDLNKDSILQGQGLNPQLNNNGVRSSLFLKNKFLSRSFTACYTSSLLRCWSTSLIVVGERYEILEDRRLIERNLGEMEGKEKKDYDMAKFWDYDLNSSENGVEPIQDLFSRCQSFLEKLLEKYDDDASILIVSHAGIIRCFHHLLSKSNLSSNLLTFTIENADVREYNISKKDFIKE